MTTPERLRPSVRAVSPVPAGGRRAEAGVLAEVIALEDYRRAAPSRTTEHAGRAPSAADAADRRPPSFATHRV